MKKTGWIIKETDQSGAEYYRWKGNGSKEMPTMLTKWDAYKTKTVAERAMRTMQEKLGKDGQTLETVEVTLIFR